MYWRTRKELQTTLRLQQRRSEGRLIVSLSMLVALLAASTVVSADAIRLLPQLWQASAVAIDAPSGPRFLAESEVRGGSRAGAESTAAQPSASANSGPLTPNESETTTAEFAKPLQAHDYADSWQQAGVDGERPGNTRRSHQVRLEAEGRLTGQIVAMDSDTGDRRPLADLRIRMLHRGTLIATGRTDEQGEFEIDGLTTGTYSLIAAGDDSLLAYALHVQVAGSDDNRPDADSPETEIGIRLDSAAIIGADVTAALSQIATLRTENVVEVSRVEPPLDQLPKAVRSLEQAGTPGTPLVRHQVQLQADGRLVGRVRYLHPESGRHLLPSTTRVMLFRDGEMVVDGVTDEQGEFQITDATPGVYSLVAITLAEELSGDVVTPNLDPTQPVGLYDDAPRRPGYATFAVEVLPAGSVRRADQPSPPPAGSPEAEEPLELDFALVDAYDMVAYTSLRVSEIDSGHSSFWGNNALADGSSPRIAPRGPAASPRPPNSVPGGGAPARFNTPFLPPETDDPMMSPSTL